MHHRWSDEHPLEVYIPDGIVDEFILFSDVEPPKVKPSKFVEVKVTRRETDKKYVLTFRLLNKDYHAIFQYFYDDVFKCTKETEPCDGASAIVERFNVWKNLFSPLPNNLSESEIQGLIGELITLEEMMEKRGETESLSAWMVAKLGKQDFVFTEHWIEVKTILSGVSTVTISSVEQLDAPNNGILRIVTLEKTSANNDKRVTLNLLYDQILDSIKHESNRNLFRDIMADRYKCPSQQYDDFSFLFIKADEYRVNEDFPRIQRKNLSDAISSVKYEIIINLLSGLKNE